MSLINGCLSRWEWVLHPEEEQETKYSFLACMALIHREVRAVPHQYPMPPDSALRIAAALSHLVAWDQTYPEVRLDKRSARKVSRICLIQHIDPSVQVVRPLVLGLKAARDWMTRSSETMEPKAKLLVNQYIELGLACCGNKSARLDLLAMNAILVLMGRLPDDSASDFMSEKLPCDPTDVTNDPRAFSMPIVAQDRHTRRGNLTDTTNMKKLPCDPTDVPNDPRAFPMPVVAQDRHTRRGNLTDTTNMLKKRCEKLEVEIPKNKEYSHGPPAHKTRQGFEEFMEHIQTCEDQTSDGREPGFKEEALRLYRAQRKEEDKKRMKILERKLGISEEKPRKRLASKRKRKEDACHLAKNRKMKQVQKDS